MLGLISEAAIFSISTISRLRQRDKAPLELTIEPSSQENNLESSAFYLYQSVWEGLKQAWVASV